MQYLILGIENSLKKIIKRDTNLWKIFAILKKYVYRIFLVGLPALPFKFERMLDLYSSQKKNIFFIQVGACDGIQNDPIYKFVNRDNWSGVLIEPVKYLFDDLVSNYNCPERIIFENSAIANQDGVKDFYYLQCPDNKLDPEKKGLGSFNRHHIPAEYEKYLKSAKVNCYTLSSMLKKHNIHHFDLLVIDSEGYDYEIIKLVDFNKANPDLIMYECCNLSWREYNSCIKYLRKKGYKLFKEENNILAYKRCNKIISKNILNSRLDQEKCIKPTSPEVRI